MAEKEGGFNPAEHLSRLSGKDYLEVKWRLVWLRDRHPDARIRTEIYSFNEQHAVFKADIEVPGGGAASGWGSETVGDFRDYLEKAETKAIGRALAALGFGTQFTDDHDFGGEQGRVVDAPVTRERAPMQAGSTLVYPAGTVERRPQAGPGPATDKQLGMLRGVAAKQNLSDEDLHGQLRARFPGKVSTKELTKQEASEFIDALQGGDIIEVVPERGEPRGQGALPEMPDWVRQAPDPWTA